MSSAERLARMIYDAAITAANDEFNDALDAAEFRDDEVAAMDTYNEVAADAADTYHRATGEHTE